MESNFEPNAEVKIGLLLSLPVHRIELNSSEDPHISVEAEG
jgi:hypothetical protein